MSENVNDACMGHLALVADMTREFAASQDLTAIARQGLGRIAERVGAEGASLFLLDAEGTSLRCYACVGPVDVTGLILPSGHGVVGRAVQTGQSQIVADTGADPDFVGLVDRQTGFHTRSIVTAPIGAGGERLGAVQLVNKTADDGRFTSNDMHLLEVMASAAGLAILNARYAEAMMERERMRSELALAAEIQRSLLPAFAADAHPIYAVNRPARTVSGDFFDVIALPDGRLWFTLGDVSGKGMNAALLMAKTASVLRCLARGGGQSPGELLAAVNAELCETNANGMFVTLVVGTYDPASGRLVIANAGHEPPLVASGGGGGFLALPAEAPPVGILTDGDGWPQTELTLDGTGFYVFTDGLTEAYTELGRGMLGAEGVMELIERHEHLPLGQRVEAIVDAAAAAAPVLRDDMTLLVIDGGRP